MREPFNVRGVIEGFYGPPYTFEQRRDLFAFLAEAGLNTYMYGPKLDPFHRKEWRQPYPAEFLDHFAELVVVGGQVGVRFVFALSPGLNFDPAVNDTERVQEKLLSLFAVGVRDFCLLFDDVGRDSPGADPQVQVDLVNDALAFLRQRDERTTLCFISNLYAGTAEQLATDTSPLGTLYSTPSSTCYRAYARIAGEVPIMWTGPGVFSDRVTAVEARRLRDFCGRPVLLWDNYPVNDTVVAQELFLAPYRGREAGVGEVLEGVLLNPMLQPQASKIPLWTAGRFFASGQAYDPLEAWEEALMIVSGGKGVDALRTLAEQFQSHPLIGDTGESARLAEAVREFFATRSAAGGALLRKIFAAFAANEREMEETLGNAALLAELREPSQKLSLLGEAGLLALELLEERGRGTMVDIRRIDELLAAAKQIPWLVGGNTRMAPTLARLLGEREARQADVLGGFFDRVLRDLGARPV